jgi:inhibitor of KinA sporulation pathway (predicted exonuclease)
MKLVVLDLELNQPSNLIIQIGAVAVDLKSKKILSEQFNKVANPGELPSEYITNLTGITQDMVANAEPLKDVLESFWSWLKSIHCDRELGAWGGDVYMVIEASKALGVDRPARVKNTDIKAVSKVFRAAMPKARKSGGLKATMDLYGLNFEGTQHDALADAINTAKLLIHLTSLVKVD